MLRKRKSCFWLALAIVLSVFAMPFHAVAKEGEDRAAVYVKVPEDWKEPCIWAWDEAGNNAFAAWPGGAMEEDSKNEGWYYAWIPVWADHVIINANEGAVQTGELLLEGKNAWVTVADAEQVEVTGEQLTEGEIPPYVETFPVHVKVDESWEKPCLWAWSAPDGKNVFEAWPGKELKETESGWYEGNLPVWVNSIIINANEGAVQTEDMSIDPAEIWVITEADGTGDFSYEDPEAKEISPVTVWVKAPADWEGPCLWAWSAPDGTNAFSAWPGEALEEDASGWMKKEVPGWVNSIIVNGTEGSVQTADLSVDPGKEVWVVVDSPEAAEVFYEKPAAAESNGKEESAAEPGTVKEPETAAETAAEPINTVKEEHRSGLLPVLFVIIAAAAVGGGIAVSRKKGRGK